MFLRPENNGREIHYFCGHSLGLQPEKTTRYVVSELEKWASQGVGGHFEEPNPWLHYHQLLKPGLARLCGARETEVNAYGSLTSNIHHLFATFYTPDKNRYKILAEETGFPSDNFAIETQVKFKGLDPSATIVYLKHDASFCYSTDYITDQIELHKESLAMIWLSAVNFLSGQVFEIEKIAESARKYGIKLGLDLAHAIGNVPLELHRWKVDFAVWCSYKYLNAGPGATGGYFVHEDNFPGCLKPEAAVLGGWWGHPEPTRFNTGIRFEPINNADAWQHSNANILSLAALRASLSIFMSGTMAELENKRNSNTLPAIESLKELKTIRVLTPEKQSGNMISVQVLRSERNILDELAKHNMVADWREPGIMRFSFCPLYNYAEEWTHFTAFLHKLL